MLEQGSRDVTAAIRAKIVAGTLPTAAPLKVWFSPGTNRPCDGCDQPITEAEVEYEIDLPAERVCRLHQKCLDLWHQERGWTAATTTDHRENAAWRQAPGSADALTTLTPADGIRKQLDEGSLPKALPEKFWGGYGQGATCSVCGDVIRQAHVQYEFTVDERAFRFHLGCFGLWEAERRRRGGRGKNQPKPRERTEYHNPTASMADRNSLGAMFPANVRPAASSMVYRADIAANKARKDAAIVPTTDATKSPMWMVVSIRMCFISHPT
jgi:hypothetical protein